MVNRLLECLEITTNGQDDPEYICAEITDKTQEEVDAIQKAIEEVMAGKHYIIRTHTCTHAEHLPCQVNLIKTV